MSEADKWNERYRSAADSPIPATARVLSDNLHLLTAHGRSLDLAAGRGANALLLAQHGFESHAWDISDVAIAQLEQAASQQRLTVHGQCRDAITQPPEPESFDLIVVSRFLERTLCPALAEALKPGGLLFYQTWTVDSSSGPSNPAYRLQRNELLRLFSGLVVIFYREEGIINAGGGEALLIARRT
ncbi:MAG TPA: class I SAM-dependent methyltransferase [Gammaproteobacteria bacterium]